MKKVTISVILKAWTEENPATWIGANFTYTYDANKNKQTETITGTMSDYGFNSTTYDDEDRLTAWSRPDTFSQEWDLSLVGNWDSFTDNGQSAVARTHNDVHEVTAVGGTSLSHDAKGNLTRDAAQTNVKYVWDFDNRLVSADTDDDATPDAGYTYDALGRRVSKTFDSATTVYTYDGQQVLAEYTAGANPSTPLRKYVYASYIDEPVMMLDGATKYYYHQNALFNVVALTNASGTPVERYSYTAYGKPTIHNADGTIKATQVSAVSNPYTYTGRRLDQETGLYYYRARYYDPSLGQFIGRDPIGYDAGSMRLYEYVESNPLINLDPLGLDKIAEDEDSVLNPVAKWVINFLKLKDPLGKVYYKVQYNLDKCTGSVTVLDDLVRFEKLHYKNIGVFALDYKIFAGVSTEKVDCVVKDKNGKECPGEKCVIKLKKHIVVIVLLGGQSNRFTMVKGTKLIAEGPCKKKEDDN